MAGNNKKPSANPRRAVDLLRAAKQAAQKPASPDSAARKGTLKQRIRPSARADARKAAIKQNPLPKPPARRPPAAPAAVAAGVGAEVATQIRRVQDKFGRLAAQAQLEDIFKAIGDIDTKLTQVPFDLEALRARGYVHSGQLEDRLAAIDDQWDAVRPRVESAWREQIERLDRELTQAERQVARLSNANAALVKTIDTAVDTLGNRVTAARRTLEGLYNGVKNELQKIEYQLGQVKKMMELIAGSAEINLLQAEGPLLAVAAKWHQDGKKEGPEGFLFLTDQRLLFEQREEVVTKKRFGIFKADSEMLQKLMVTTQVHEIEQIVHKEEGGFLGMGKDDILELVFAATAPLSRARFHLKGQDSKDWAAMINRIQSGEIDGDRSEGYLEELETASITSARFPEQCPTCFAALPVQPRGVTSCSCEFCGATVRPLGSES